MTGTDRGGVGWGGACGLWGIYGSDDEAQVIGEGLEEEVG